MILSLADIQALVQAKTGKTIDLNGISLVCGGASSISESLNVVTPDENICYACKVEHFSAAAGQIVFDLNGSSTELSINAIGEEKGYRSYDLVIFNSITGDVSDDTEIHFTGYKFNLI